MITIIPKNFDVCKLCKYFTAHARSNNGSLPPGYGCQLYISDTRNQSEAGICYAPKPKFDNTPIPYGCLHADKLKIVSKLKTI